MHQPRELPKVLRFFLWAALAFVSEGCSSDEADSSAATNGDGGSRASGDGDGDGSGGTRVGTGGASGDGDEASGGAPVTSPPLGCNEPYDGPRGEWVRAPALPVDGDERTFWTWVPQSYDPEVELPVVFLFHGCGDETNNLPLEDWAGEDAILVRGLADGPNGCWLTADDTNSLFFRAMLTTVSESFCADRDRIFVVGYDSGAELVSRLGCYEAYLIDGVATVAGENALPYGTTSCSGPVAAMLFHDADDTEQDISESEEVRDRLIDQNFCVTDGIPEAVEPDPCIRYSGCGDPVLWCATTGQGHDRQDAFAAPAIWSFFSSL